MTFWQSYRQATLYALQALWWAPGLRAPESYTDEQMEEFDQLMEPWLEHYERKRSAGGK